MELKVKTTELQDMVSKASKCVSNNKLIPLTSLINIKVAGNNLSLTTTDATNYLYVFHTADCEDFEVSVNADLFIKLVQKMTSDTITLVLENNNLTIKGNGKYTMEVPQDEDGGIIKFPDKVSNVFGTQSTPIKTETIKNILVANKPSLAVSIELPSLTCYYCDNKVVTSDSYKICSNSEKLFDEPTLISGSLMEVLGVLTGETIEVTKCEAGIIFSTDFESVYAPIEPGLNTFPIAAINGLIDQEFNHDCTISKDAVLNLLDRLSLFVSPYDKKGIYLTFTKDGVLFSSKKSSGTESIPYIETHEFEDYTCCIDIDMLRSQVSTVGGEKLNLYYGSDVAIKIVNEGITEIVALSEDDRTL